MKLENIDFTEEEVLESLRHAGIEIVDEQQELKKDLLLISANLLGESLGESICETLATGLLATGYHRTDIKTIEEIARDLKTCGDCDNYTGYGDWNLCCKNPPEEDIGWCGHLCYSYTPACRNFKPKSHIQHKDPCGRRGVPDCCPKCGARSDKLSWNTKTDECTCACGWSNGINYKYLYEELPEKIRIALRHFGPKDKFNKTFFFNIIDETMKEN